MQWVSERSNVDNGMEKGLNLKITQQRNMQKKKTFALIW